MRDGTAMVAGRIVAGQVFGTVLAAMLLAATPASAARIVNTFNDWTLYTEANAQQVCFLAGLPGVTEPAGLKRDPALLYVSAWPKDGVKAEISVKLGFPAKKASEPVITIQGAATGTFKLFVKDDRAYVADATQELKLLEAMKKGSKLIVQATSERGTAVVDTYSLAGITAALTALAGGCPG
jgi:invasion protein IalB